MPYEVYRVENKLAFPDPEMPQPRYHNTIFILTSPSTGSGYTHHVTGDIVTGMVYQSRPDPAPETIDTFHAKYFIGFIDEHDYPEKVEQVLTGEDCKPPGKQKEWNPKRMRYEQMKDGGGFYEEGEERKRMVKCTEWVLEQAIPALVREGILKRSKEGGIGESLETKV